MADAELIRMLTQIRDELREMNGKDAEGNRKTYATKIWDGWRFQVSGTYRSDNGEWFLVNKAPEDW